MFDRGLIFARRNALIITVASLAEGLAWSETTTGDRTLAETAKATFGMDVWMDNVTILEGRQVRIGFSGRVWRLIPRTQEAR